MATKGTISTKGFDEYLERIAAAGRNVDAAAARAVLAGAEPVRDEMLKLVPRDTENLAEHIDIDGPHQDGNFVYAEVGVLHADSETARYGNAQEYGTSSMPAQPHIRPGIERAKTKSHQAMRASLEEDAIL